MAAKKKRRKRGLSRRVQQRQERAAEGIRDAFRAMVEKVREGEGPSWAGEGQAFYAVRKGRDGTVDGLFRLTDLPRFEGADKLLLDVEDSGLIRVPPRFKIWLQIGFVGTFAEPPTPKQGGEPPSPARKYARYRGADMVLVYSQQPKSMAGHFVTARAIAERLEAKDKTPQQIIVRMFWKPGGSRPKRKGN